MGIDLYRTDLRNPHLHRSIHAGATGTLLRRANCRPDGSTPILFLEQPINLAGTVYTGIESNATLPLSDHFSFDPYYNIQAAYPTDVPLATEQVILGNVVDNQQYLGVPIHKYGAGH